MRESANTQRCTVINLDNSIAPSMAKKNKSKQLFSIIQFWSFDRIY